MKRINLKKSISILTCVLCTSLFAKNSSRHDIKINSKTIEALGKEYHVSINGNDGDNGSSAKPFKTIKVAANKAMPRDIITVHVGAYWERVTPPRGGESNTKRIVYRAASGEKVIITGSEIVKGWTLVGNNVWKVTLANSFFGKFNPYEDLIHGDWFMPDGGIVKINLLCFLQR